MNPKLRLLMVVVTCGVAMSGCSGPSKVEYARAYPAEKVQLETADVHAQRFETEIKMTNTTARDLGPGMVWVNQQWAHPLEGLRIGESVTLSLKDFVNEYSERFRAGGFFATERPDVIMQVQYEEDGAEAMLGMIAVGERAR